MACNFIQMETLAHVFSCKFCGISIKPFLQNTSERLLLNRTYSFLIFFFFAFAFFPFAVIFTDWFLLAKNYFNAATLNKVINNQIKQNFPRFPSFQFWVLGKIENSEISDIYNFILNHI